MGCFGHWELVVGSFSGASEVSVPRRASRRSHGRPARHVEGSGDRRLRRSVRTSGRRNFPRPASGFHSQCRVPRPGCQLAQPRGCQALLRECQPSRGRSGAAPALVGSSTRRCLIGDSSLPWSRINCSWARSPFPHRPLRPRRIQTRSPSACSAPFPLPEDSARANRQRQSCRACRPCRPGLRRR
jgi:hypothetical protein